MTFLFDRLFCFDLMCIQRTDAGMMARVLPKNPDLETEDETYHTWHIQDWRRMRQKEHGPIFHCAGFPWCVHTRSTILEIA